MSLHKVFCQYFRVFLLRSNYRLFYLEQSPAFPATSGSSGSSNLALSTSPPTAPSSLKDSTAGVSLILHLCIYCEESINLLHSILLPCPLLGPTNHHKKKQYNSQISRDFRIWVHISCRTVYLSLECFQALLLWTRQHVGLVDDQQWSSVMFKGIFRCQFNPCSKPPWNCVRLPLKRSS